MKSWVFLIFGGILSFSGAAAADCLNADEVAGISADFQFVSKEKNLKFDICDEKNRFHQIYAALISLKNYPAQNSASDKFDRNLISVPPYDFFKQRVKTVVMEDDSNHDYCGAGFSAFVPYRPGPKISEIHICREMMKFDWFQAAAILLHEAWHTGGHPHKMCANGPPLPACDASYEAGGSYAINTEFFVKASRNSELHPVLRAQAYAGAVGNFFKNFNKKPFGLAAGELIQTKQGALVFYQGQMTEALPASANTQDLIFSKDGSISVYRSANQEVTDFSVQGAISKVQDETTSNIKNTMGDDRDAILDIYASADETCVLTSRFVRCRSQEKVSEYPIHDFKPVQLMLSEESILVRANSLNVSAEDGFLYQSQGKKGWKKSAKKLDIKNSVGISPESDLVLLLDGRAVLYNAKKKSWSTPAELKDLSVDRILSPYFWSQELEQL